VRVRGGGDPEFGGLLRQRGPPADPQLAVLPVAEELVALAGGPGPDVQRGVVAGAGGPHDQHAVRVVVAGEPDKVAAGPERVGGVVRPYLLPPGRDHQGVLRERGREGGPARGVPIRLRRGRHLPRQLSPSGTHELEELLRKLGIVRGLAGLAGPRGTVALLGHGSYRTP